MTRRICNGYKRLRANMVNWDGGWDSIFWSDNRFWNESPHPFAQKPAVRSSRSVRDAAR